MSLSELFQVNGLLLLYLQKILHNWTKVSILHNF